MKGIKTDKSRLRKLVFSEVARLAYEGSAPGAFDDLPYKLVDTKEDPYRETIFLERSLLGERIRACMGMSLRTLDEHTPVSKGLEEAMDSQKYYEPPLIDIIKFACNRCPDKRVYISDGCQGCLEHPCKEVCPKKCITLERRGGRAVIDETQCIKCGRCMQECRFNAIIKQERPCVSVCGMGAIEKDEYGNAVINQDKCVSCGQCLNSCPFAAIVDKSQIYQTVRALVSDTPVYAIIAPSMAGQFGKGLTDEKIRGAFAELGFADVYEVAVGADLCCIEEAEHFVREVPAELPFMCTSCCPAWSKMAKKEFPEFADCISMAMTPMVLTARLIKQRHPESMIVFVGPCLAKKKEASRRAVKSYVDFVLTYEELDGMFKAKEVDFDAIEDSTPPLRASADAFGFARSGGVAQAVVNHVRRIDPDREVKIVKAEGLDECMKMMRKAAKGEYDGYLLEGMACPGGCIAGAGTMQPVTKSSVTLDLKMKSMPVENSTDTAFAHMLKSLENYPEIMEIDPFEDL